MAPRDFNIDGLAIYLHLTPAQVNRMVTRGKLPGRRVGGQWRFPEAEIHHWLEDRIGASEDDDALAEMEGFLQNTSAGDTEIRIRQLLPIEAISYPLRARTRQSVITRMVELAAQTGWVWDPDRLVDTVRARETLQSTALDNGVALLHPRRPQNAILERPLLALGRTAGGIPFGATRGGLTDLFFLICSVDDKQHLRTLARLCRLLGDPDLLASIRCADDPVTMHAVIANYEAAHFE